MAPLMCQAGEDSAQLGRVKPGVQGWAPALGSHCVCSARGAEPGLEVVAAVSWWLWPKGRPPFPDVSSVAFSMRDECWFEAP